MCATLAPAGEENEDRTILLVGDLGAADDPPAWIEIVGSVPPEDGTDASGAETDDVVALEDGPSLVLAEHVTSAAMELGAPDDCPADTTVAIVRTIWNGGVDGNRGRELDSTNGFAVQVSAGDGTNDVVAPIALGDLNDGDNNVDLCLDDARMPVQVAVDAHTVTDPTNDWNEATSVAVVPD